MTVYTSLGDIPRKSYDILVSDFPWHIAGNSEANPGRNPRRHYPTLTDGQIASLPIAAIMADDCLHFMWTTAPLLERAMALPKAWRQRYSTFVPWDKTVGRSNAGTGFWFRGEHEPCLLYRRGTYRRPGDKAPFEWSIIRELKREHSRKPRFLMDEIDRAFPAARKLELFARNERPGWDCFGNEVGKYGDD